MANIELIIKIPEEKYNQIINSYQGSNVRPKDYEIAIINGIPLSKGHGKIIDESKINKCEQIGLIIKDNNIIRCFATDAPTIIEADRSKE